MHVHGLANYFLPSFANHLSVHTAALSLLIAHLQGLYPYCEVDEVNLNLRPMPLSYIQRALQFRMALPSSHYDSCIDIS